MYSIVSENECVGCGACHDSCPENAIKMHMNSEGFMVPIIKKEDCIECSNCIKNCPVHSINLAKCVDNQYEVKAFVAWSKNESERKKGTSGGIFLSFAKHIIMKDGYVFGATYDNQMKVKHKSVNTIEDLYKLSGSKYLQSDTSGIFKETKTVLDNGRKVLFSGTPCQIKALYSYLDKKYDNLITCEIFCHGVPSPGLFRSYISYLEKKMISKVTSFNFRSKEVSWNNPRIIVEFQNGKRIINKHIENSYMVMFGKHLSVRKSCYLCPARSIKNNFDNITVKRVSDISIGDYWGVEKYYNYSTKKGFSALLINSTKGEELVNECSESVYIEESNLCNIIKKNKPLVENYPIPEGRDRFWYRYNKYPASVFFNFYRLIFIRNRIINKIIFECRKLLGEKKNE